MAVEFHILQPLQIVRDGQLVNFGGSKQRAVLADLLIHANQTLSADRLIDDLWGERPPPSATNALQVYISGIRKALGPIGTEKLVTRKPGYLLAVETSEFDLFQFYSLVAQGRAVMSTDPGLTAAKLTEAIALWRGPPLGDLEFEDFVAREVLRLEEVHAGVVEDLVEAELSLLVDMET